MLASPAVVPDGATVRIIELGDSQARKRAQIRAYWIILSPSPAPGWSYLPGPHFGMVIIVR